MMKIKIKNIKSKAFLYADQYNQSDFDILKSKTLKKDRKVKNANNKNKKKDVKRKASRYAE